MSTVRAQILVAEQAIRDFPYADYGLDEVEHALLDFPDRQEWPAALARLVVEAVLTEQRDNRPPRLSSFHRYRSTACLHNRCGECRNTCKFCKTLCVCSCHQLDFEPAAA